MGVKRYVKAEDALPPELIEAVSKCLGGREAYLWIPAVRNLRRSGRARYVVDLKNQGLSSREIADRLCISERHVRRILSNKKAACLPSRAVASRGDHQ